MKETAIKQVRQRRAPEEKSKQLSIAEEKGRGLAARGYPWQSTMRAGGGKGRRGGTCRKEKADAH